MKRLFRNANIGIAVSVTINLVGLAFLYDDEAALEVLGLTAFLSGLAVLLALNIRDYRAEHKGPPGAT
jgi:hypothetical protein